MDVDSASGWFGLLGSSALSCRHRQLDSKRSGNPGESWSLIPLEPDCGKNEDPLGMGTPWKINMEPENRWFVEENSLSRSHSQGPC